MLILYLFVSYGAILPLAVSRMTRECLHTATVPHCGTNGRVRAAAYDLQVSLHLQPRLDTFEEVNSIIDRKIGAPLFPHTTELSVP
ncbi:uncharacterized protein EI90DRAFT_3030982 [Cantharellus anzutake]|uniref:uncharacterized protein n=1 Tax=Cantharellus anzutake TaxID=1750568 RepID=UPI0019079494|nr:uncharacterized protein EI90DRAFT_3030982 [Cantharellus anzutake]KAF8342990.1 hypothetical protein EI90DRAFT_3030982 [Cantharellus anzutake]